jgi:hypothetical protein
MLTEDSNWPEKQRKMVGDEVRAAETAVLVGKAAVGGFGVPWTCGSVGELPPEVTRGLRRIRMLRRRGIPTAERLTVEGSFGKFGRCRGVGLRCWARGASGWRRGAFAVDVVVRGAAERPVYGEAEASARQRGEGGGGAAGLQGCCCGYV